MLWRAYRATGQLKAAAELFDVELALPANARQQSYSHAYMHE